ncbi:hypothetical protein HB770_10990 [Rhizobium leguminosarum bv. viciae]|uniref:Uncharacterized protein n=1 Tax=Rhizobium leguminosarum bv. viciae TaxID=387 RepID=A0A7G6RH22_RHILV|nr:hypothetical protein HB770_10990 [Rhizobium leguminosarum bv. viciae]
MTFLEAYALHGPDVERIAEALGITPPEADRLINEVIERLSTSSASSAVGGGHERERQVLCRPSPAI